MDDSLVILDSNVGWPGCIHDARVLRNSPLYEKIEAGDLMFPGLFIIGMFYMYLFSLDFCNFST